MHAKPERDPLSNEELENAAGGNWYVAAAFAIGSAFLAGYEYGARPTNPGIGAGTTNGWGARSTEIVKS